MVIAVLFLLALGTGLYTLEANRKTFARLQHLTEQLQSQSEALQKLSWKLIDVQEDTLRRVARDLHDEFGQILTAIGAMLSRTGKRAGDGDANRDGAVVQELQAVQKIVQETLQTVRDQSQRNVDSPASGETSAEANSGPSRDIVKCSRREIANHTHGSSDSSQ